MDIHEQVDSVIEKHLAIDLGEERIALEDICYTSRKGKGLLLILKGREVFIPKTSPYYEPAINTLEWIATKP